MAQCVPSSPCIFFNDKMTGCPAAGLFPSRHARAERLIAEKKGLLT